MPNAPSNLGLFRPVRLLSVCVAVCAAAGCAEPPKGLAPAGDGDGPEIVFDFARKPLPEIPLPNDLATRPDPTSPTGKRINASMVAPTNLEATARRRIDELSGWGAYQTITVSFDAPIDVADLWKRHRDYLAPGGRDYGFEDDAIFVVDVTPGSPTYGQPVPLDFGEGNFPVLLRTPNQYWEHDPKTITKALALETYEEDRDQDGEMDPGEDLDLDGVLDHPNVHPAQDGDPTTLDPNRDLVGGYEYQTNTLMFKPILPLREKTTYAVVITKRVRDFEGNPVRSPFEYVNHTDQTDDLAPLEDVMGDLGLSLDDVAFAWSFTTQDSTGDLVAIRNGMYGAGPLAWLAEDNPPELTHLSMMVDEEDPDGNPVANRYILTPERMQPLLQPFAEAAFGNLGTFTTDVIEENQSYYAYHISGRFRTPYFLDLEDEGNLDARAWPANLFGPSLRERMKGTDPLSGEPHYREVQFFCSIPRDEYKKDPDAPAPVVLYAHGYTSNKLEPFGLAIYGKFGLAVCSIDAVAHGVNVGDQLSQVRFLLAALRLSSLEEALLSGRARDLDGDGMLDEGADMFTAYQFRTRDNLRQTLVDWMTLVRLLRTFGEGTMVDVDGDGTPETLGDFDGDGDVDLGGDDVPFFASGTSLGGLISSALSGIEPKVIAAAPISGGAGLVDLAIRSEQGGVVEALMLRLAGPQLVGEPTADGSAMRIYQLVPRDNEDYRHTVAIRPEIQPGDTVMLTNLRTGDARCARVMPDDPPPGYEDFRGWPKASNCADNDPAGTCRTCPEGTAGTYACDLARTFRVGVPADAGDPLRLDVFVGPDAVEVEPDERQCTAKEDAEIRVTVDTFEVGGSYRCGADENGQPVLEDGAPLPNGQICRHLPEGEELVALEDGYGFQRATPVLRKFTNLAQIIVEPADPAVYAVHYSREPLTFMEGDEEFTAPPANVFNVTTIGDPNVPVNVGVAIAKVAGFIELFEPDERYGKTRNRVIIDEGIQEGIPWLEVKGPEWGPVLVDADVLSGCDNGPMEVCPEDGLMAPRLSPPLRIVIDTPGSEDGKSGIVFPMTDEFNGVHGFPPPGIFDAPFDVGQFMIHQLGWFFRTEGTEVRYDHCMGEGVAACPWIPPPPAP
ncbi:MAG: hypothetical protein D6705_16910 [Deltaproteobacteria bacterium]|nr:MAG: hypothetical protein D6705_16910 [Deltaproteobacteria bacterium]